MHTENPLDSLFTMAHQAQVLQKIDIASLTIGLLAEWRLEAAVISPGHTVELLAVSGSDEHETRLVFKRSQFIDSEGPAYQWVVAPASLFTANIAAELALRAAQAQGEKILDRNRFSNWKDDHPRKRVETPMMGPREKQFSHLLNLIVDKSANPIRRLDNILSAEHCAAARQAVINLSQK